MTIVARALAANVTSLVGLAVVVACLLAPLPTGAQPAAIPPRTDRYGDPLPTEALARLGTTRFRTPAAYQWHGSPALSYTPDGRLLVGGTGGPAVVWEAATGKELRRLGTEMRQPMNAILSADGELVAVGGWAQLTGGGAVYELATGRKLFPFGKGGQNTFARFSPDGRYLACYDLNQQILLLDGRTGKRVRILAGHERTEKTMLHAVVEVLFTPDSKTLISAGGDGTIRFWDVASGQEKRQISASDEALMQMCLSPDGTRIASLAWVRVRNGNGGSHCGSDRRVRIWDAATGKELREIVVPPDGEKEGLPRGARLLGFAPDGHVITHGGDRMVRIWDVRSGTELRQWKDETELSMLTFAPDGKTMATVEGMRTVHVRDVASRCDLVSFDGHPDGVHVLALSRDGRIAATAGEFETILLWDPLTGRLQRRLPGPKNWVATLHFSGDSRTVFSTGYGGGLQVWDVTTSKKKYHKAAAKGATGAWACVAPNGTMLAWSGRPKCVLLLEAATGQELRQLDAFDDDCSIPAFTPDGQALHAWVPDQGLCRWDTATGQRRDILCKDLGEYLNLVAFAPDCALVALGRPQGDLFLLNTATGQVVQRVATAAEKPDGNVYLSCVAFSPDGRTLAWAGPKDHAVRLWEVASGKERHRLAGHLERVTALAFSANGERLVTGSDDATALVWDLAGRVDRAAEGTGPLTAAAFAACWEELLSNDAAQAYRALRRLIADPVRAIPWLAQRLRPTTPPDGPRVARLVAEIDSDDFATRDAATAELARVGESVLPALHKVLSGRPTLETRRRVERLVKDLETPSGERLRAVRGVEALETIGTADARRLLEALAAGSPGPRLTREASAAVERLRKR